MRRILLDLSGGFLGIYECEFILVADESAMIQHGLNPVKSTNNHGKIMVNTTITN